MREPNLQESKNQMSLEFRRIPEGIFVALNDGSDALLDAIRCAAAIDGGLILHGLKDVMSYSVSSI